MYLYLRYTVWKNSTEEMPTLHQFRKKLAFALIENKWIVRDDEEVRMTRKRKGHQHELRTCPSHARAFVHGKWDCTAKSKYQQHLHFHNKSKHLEIRYPCDQCDYRATKKFDLKEHIQVKHESGGYPCSEGS